MGAMARAGPQNLSATLATGIRRHRRAAVGILVTLLCATLLYAATLPAPRTCDCFLVRQERSRWCDEQCRELGKACSDCSDIHQSGKEQKLLECAHICAMHGTCPKPAPVYPDSAVHCPAYDPRLREDRVRLLESLGATVHPQVPGIGVQVHNLDLGAPWVLRHEPLLCALKDLVTDELFVLLPNQTLLCQRQLEISYTFGRLYHGGHHRDLTPHPYSQGRMVLIFANDPKYGITPGVFNRWHFDSYDATCTHGSLHFTSTPHTGGHTGFCDTRQVFQVGRLAPETRQLWRRLWWWNSQIPEVVYPLLIRHPLTGATLVYLAEGRADRFGLDMDLPSAQPLSVEESAGLLLDIEYRVCPDGASQEVFNVTWRTGDLLLRDNLALLHRAWPESNRPAHEIGLRVFRAASAGCGPETASSLHDKGGGPTFEARLDVVDS
eukprot:jgi/Mesvir1/2825/Mv13920-RA.1